MKVNLNRNLLDFRGREFIELVNGKESKKSVRDLVAEALFAAGSNPQKNMETSKKLRAYKMLQQIISNRGVLNIETEDAALLKEICGEYLTAGTYLSLIHISEPTRP